MDEQPREKKSRTAGRRIPADTDDAVRRTLPGYRATDEENEATERRAESEDLRDYLDTAGSEAREPADRWDALLWLGTEGPLVEETYQALRWLTDHTDPLVAKGAKKGLGEFEERARLEGLNLSELPRRFSDSSQTSSDAPIQEESPESRVRVTLKGRKRLMQAVRRLVEEDPGRWEISSIYDTSDQTHYCGGMVPLGDLACLVDYTRDGRGRVTVTKIQLVLRGTVTSERARAERPGRQDESEEARLPAAPESKTVEGRQLQLLEAVRKFAEAHPERAKELADQVMQVAEEKGGPRRERTLGLREAARRISAARGKTLSSVQLLRYFRDPNIQIGAPGPDGKPRFSEYECDHFIPPDRPPGRPRKITPPLS